MLLFRSTFRLNFVAFDFHFGFRAQPFGDTKLTALQFSLSHKSVLMAPVVLFLQFFWINFRYNFLSRYFSISFLSSVSNDWTQILSTIDLFSFHCTRKMSSRTIDYCVLFIARNSLDSTLLLRIHNSVLIYNSSTFQSKLQSVFGHLASKSRFSN